MVSRHKPGQGAQNLNDENSSMTFPMRDIPPLAMVKQSFPTDCIRDVRSEVKERLQAAGLRKKVQPGARIAITAGSRGIGGFLALVQGIADAIRSAGGKPFIIPTMGSHGGATAGGQRELLELLGISEATVKTPIRS